MKLILVLLICVAFLGCKSYQEFDPQIAGYLWQDRQESIEEVRNLLSHGEYAMANDFVQFIDKSDSAIVSYYQECGRSAQRSGIIFVGDPTGKIWYTIIDYKHIHSKNDYK